MNVVFGGQVNSSKVKNKLILFKSWFINRHFVLTFPSASQGDWFDKYAQFEEGLWGFLQFVLAKTFSLFGFNA